MNAKHTHHFELGKSKKIETCDCGKWRHVNLDPKDITTEVRSEPKAQHTPTPLVHEQPNYDSSFRSVIRKGDKSFTDREQDFTPDEWDEIVEAVNAYEKIKADNAALLEAAKHFRDCRIAVLVTADGFRDCEQCKRYSAMIEAL